MRRVTITLDDDLEASLDVYIKQQAVAPPLTVVVRAALKEYLEHRGFVSGRPKLRITPARKGSGVRDISARHDRYLAGR